MNSNQSYYKLSSLFFFIYFAIGSATPLFSNYLDSIGLTGTQIGTIGTIGSIIMIISPPLFGYISDKLHAHKIIFQMLIISSLIFSLLMLLPKSYRPILIISSVFFVFQRPLMALTDGIGLSSSISFGKMRLWGSIGFAFSILIASFLSQYFKLSIIFIVYATSVFIALLFLIFIKMPNKNTPNKDSDSIHQKHLKKDIKILIHNKSFLLFLLYTFLYGGTISGCNNYLGLLYSHLGGSILGIGIVFLILTLTEVPFLHIAPKWIEKWGIENMLLFSSIIVTARWILYASGPSPIIILLTSPIQGLAYGTYMIGYADYVRENVPKTLHSSAMTLVSSISYGLSGVFILYIAGYLYEFYNAQLIFLLFTFCSALSIFIIFIIKCQKRRNNVS